MNSDSNPIVTNLVNTSTIGAIAISGGTAINIIQQLYSGFAPAMLHNQIETVLSQFRQGNKEIAKGQLTILRSMGGQDPNILPALDIVLIYLNLINAEETAKARQQLTTFLAQPANETPSLLNDLCMAALLRLTAKDGDVDANRILWGQLTSPGPHSRETFYALIATPDELEEVTTSRALSLSATELRGVVEGALRLQQYQLADRAVRHLVKADDGPLAAFLEFSVMAGLIQSSIGHRQFWSLPATIHDSLLELAERAAVLLLLQPLPDSRLPLYVAKLFMYLHGASKNLLNACLVKINLIEEADRTCAAQVRFLHAGDISGLSEIEQLIIKAGKDLTFQKQRVDELLSKTALKLEDSVVLALFANPCDLKKWLSDGGGCEDEDGLTKDMIMLNLHCCAVESPLDRNSVRFIRRICG